MRPSPLDRHGNLVTGTFELAGLARELDPGLLERLPHYGVGRIVGCEKDNIAAVGPQEQSLLPRVGQVANDADTPVGRFIGIADRTVADRAVVDTGFEPRIFGLSSISPYRQQHRPRGKFATIARRSERAVRAARQAHDPAGLQRGSVLHCLIAETREQFRASDTLEAGIILVSLGMSEARLAPSIDQVHAARR